MKFEKGKPERPYYRQVEPSKLPESGLTKEQRQAASAAILAGKPLSIDEILKIGKRRI